MLNTVNITFAKLNKFFHVKLFYLYLVVYLFLILQGFFNLAYGCSLNE